MKILFIIHETSKYNGAYKSVKILLDGLKEKGVDLLIITPDKNGNYEELNENFNVKCVKGYTHYYWGVDYKFKFIKDSVKHFKEFVWVIKMLPIVQNFKPDIIVSNSGSLKCGYKLAHVTGRKHVMYLREFLDKDFKLSTEYVDKLIKGNKSYYITVIKKIAENRNLLENKYCKVIYNSVVPTNSEMVDLNQRKYILYVGGLTVGKGFHDLIYAYYKYVKYVAEPMPLWIAGGNPESIYYAKSSKEIKRLGDLVNFLGYRDDVPELMRNAYAVIVPSFYEAFGRVMPEAMANRCLAIARNTAGLKEHFDNGLQMFGREIGLRFKDKEELVKILVSLKNIEDCEYYKMINSAFEMVKKLYAPQRMVDEVYKLFTTLA